MLQIEPGTYHRSAVGSKRGLRLIELETPKDKFDLVRMEDDYERTTKPYESVHAARLAPVEPEPMLSGVLAPLLEQLVAGRQSRMRAKCLSGRFRFALESGLEIDRRPHALIFAIALEPRANETRGVTVLGLERLTAIDRHAIHLTIRSTDQGALL